MSIIRQYSKIIRQRSYYIKCNQFSSNSLSFCNGAAEILCFSTSFVKDDSVNFVDLFILLYIMYNITFELYNDVLEP